MKQLGKSRTVINTDQQRNRPAEPMEVHTPGPGADRDVLWPRGVLRTVSRERQLLGPFHSFTTEGMGVFAYNKHKLE